MYSFQDIHEALTSAMKAGETERRDVIRMLESALKNEAIEARKPVTELSEQEMIAVVRRLVKQRNESATEYRKGGREDLASKEESEISVLEAYLPATMPDDEIRAAVAAAKAETGASSKADFGKLMGASVTKVAGRADGNAVRKFVEEALSE